MLVVSDTSPLINLAAIDHLWLIPEIYGQVFIPPAVYHEIVVVGMGEPGATEIQAADWVIVQACTSNLLLEQLALDLDPGEAEAIALAVELSADRILIDEKKVDRLQLVILLSQLEYWAYYCAQNKKNSFIKSARLWIVC